MSLTPDGVIFSDGTHAVATVAVTADRVSSAPQGIALETLTQLSVNGRRPGVSALDALLERRRLAGRMAAVPGHGWLAPAPASHGAALYGTPGA
ncbi:MAG: hypothetical protein KGJ62_07405 [Armatimonadetes bacterium]|nr:hypothetical protein [Armatimonadota bacterium]MDE2207769.1 hypothetical protein [Armatimonadota bacterium]